MSLFIKFFIFARAPLSYLEILDPPLIALASCYLEQRILDGLSEEICIEKHLRAVVTESVQSMSLLQNFIQMNSKYLMRLVFIPAYLQDYDRRLLNAN